MIKNIKKIVFCMVAFFVMGAQVYGANAAGAAKPEGAQREVDYEVLEVNGSPGSGGSASSCGLFDGIQVDSWNTSNIMYWNSASNYIDLIIDEESNIWRSGTKTWYDHKGILQILKWDGKQYNLITETVDQVTSNITHTQWEKTISNLPAGQYRFQGGLGYRIDSEWYIEATDVLPKHTMKVVLEPREEMQLSVDEDLEENTKLLWSSSNEKIATVDKDGIVKAVAAGNIVITVKDPNSDYEEKIKVLVVEDAKKYRLAVDLKISRSCRVTVDDYTFSKNVVWSVMDESIATVDSKGKIMAVGKGLTVVTATDELGNVIDQIYVRVRV